MRDELERKRVPARRDAVGACTPSLLAELITPGDDQRAGGRGVPG